MHSLYLSPRRYSQHCFIAMNSAPKDDDMILVCFLLHQWTNEQFKYTNIPVRDLLVTVSEAWSASTLAMIVNLIPLSSGMLGGSSSLPLTCPNSLDVQSFFSKSCSFIVLGQKRVPHCDTFSNIRISALLVPCDLSLVVPNVMTSWRPPGKRQHIPAPQSTGGFQLVTDSMRHLMATAPLKHPVLACMLIT